MLPFVNRGGSFLASSDNYHLSKVVIVGLPMDFTVSFRPGTRNGPGHIRQASTGIEEYSPVLDKNLSEVEFYDAGDIELPFGNVQKSLERIQTVAATILRDGKLPLFLGGEHLVTFPLITAMKTFHKDLAVIQFDAHADLRVDYLGEKNSHASVIRRLAEQLGPENIYQLGIRSGTREEFNYGREKTGFYPFRVLEPIENIAAALKGRPVYITLDIDVVDPAYAPGTGTPEPGGCTSGEILQAVHALRDLQIVGADIVEVSPFGDQGLLTGLLAAKLVREIILGFWS